MWVSWEIIRLLVLVMNKEAGKNKDVWNCLVSQVICRYVIHRYIQRLLILAVQALTHSTIILITADASWITINRNRYILKVHDAWKIQ